MGHIRPSLTTAHRQALSSRILVATFAAPSSCARLQPHTSLSPSPAMYLAPPIYPSTSLHLLLSPSLSPCLFFRLSILHVPLHRFFHLRPLTPPLFLSPSTSLSLSFRPPLTPPGARRPATSALLPSVRQSLGCVRPATTSESTSSLSS